MSDLAIRLGAHELLASLDLHVLETLADCAHETEFDAGATIYSEGLDQRCFFLIIDGDVALQTASPNRAPATFQTLHAGDFAGVSWLAEPHRSRFDAIALSKVKAIAFDAACLRAKCDTDPALGYALLQRFIPPLLSRMETARLQALNLYSEPT